jgi:hypothetical protein
MAEKTTKRTAEVMEMVEDAIRSLKEPGGSSVHAIKKYVSAYTTLMLRRCLQLS